MRSLMPVVSAVTLYAAILAGPAVLTAQTCPNGYSSTVPITIKTDGSAADACLNQGGKVTFTTANAGDIFTAIFLSSPFKDGHRIDATGLNTDDTIIKSSPNPNGYKYIACYYASGSTAPVCQDPKIIVNPTGLYGVVIGVSKPNVVFRPGELARSLKIENKIKSQVTIERIEKIGKPRAKESFHVTESCDNKPLPQPLPPGGVCTAEVTFTGKESQTLTLVVKYQGGQLSNQIKVTGAP
jgi:hypothetical protein